MAASGLEPDGSWRAAGAAERSGRTGVERGTRREVGPTISIAAPGGASPSPGPAPDGHLPDLADLDLDGAVQGILQRHATVGLAVGAVRDGRLAYVHGHGLADVVSGTPVTADTVFRIASVTKLFTAISIMQLVERGLVDLDAPVSEYLLAYRVVPARPGFRQPTVRELLTHTAGIPEVVHVRDLLHPGWGPFGSRPAEHSVAAGEPMPTLATYYAGGLRVAVEPGTAFQYTNHGFATLGQIVEDVSGTPLARYLRERVLGPLGMEDSDLGRSDRVAARLATGYVLGSAGPVAVPDRDWICAGAGGLYSTPRDLARFTVALLGCGANGIGRVLDAATLATMFEPHYRPDARIPGRGLGFFRADCAGHTVVGHDGLLPGFDARLVVAPEAGVGVFAMTNGASGAFVWLGVELDRLLRLLLGAPEATVRRGVPQRPETWSRLCGRYRLPPGTDLRGRVAMGAGAEVAVRRGRLLARILTPVPALLAGLPLEADDEHDPDVFRLDLSALGMPAVRVVFAQGPGPASAVYVDLPGQPLSLERRSPLAQGHLVATASLGAIAGTSAAALMVRRRRGRDAAKQRRQSP